MLNDLFSDVDGITSKSMFGGYGYYKNGVIFGMIANGKLYFKVNEESKTEYAKYNSQPFIYHGKSGKQVSMGYWELPADIMEDKDELHDWIDKAYHVSLASKKK